VPSRSVDAATVRGAGGGRIDVVHRLPVFRLLIAALVLLPASAWAAYPDRPIALVVPYPAGGRTDVVARLVAEHLKAHVGQPVVILNVAGAGGVVGAKEVSRATPDGHVLGFFSTGVVVTQYTTIDPPTLAEYEPIAQVNMDPAVLAVRGDSPYRRLGDLLARGPQPPGSFKVGVTFGASSHMFAAAFARMTGVSVSYVPFAGDPQSLTALAGGHIQGAVSVPGLLRPWVQQGSLRALAVAAEAPVPAYGEVPTFRAEGVDLVMGSWHGVFAPRATPPAVIASVARALEQVTADPRFREKMARLPTTLEFRGPAAFAAFLREEDARTRVIVDNVGLAVGPRR
jgi:tripartite-type tricarboxylate transporter receptor subunit TctC